MERSDNVTPGCKSAEGCLVPPLGPEEARVMELRARVMRLRELVGAEAVLRLSGATLKDLELLAVVEDTLKEMDRDDRA